MKPNQIESLLNNGEYADIIREAERRGYRRSALALAREADENSIGQFGVTLDEAVDYLRREVAA